MRKHYFNLQELMWVIAVVVLLLVGGAVMIPMYIRFRTRETRRRVNCADNLRQIGRALTTYSDQYDSWFPAVQPPGRNFEPLNELGFLSNGQVYGCPSLWRTRRGRARAANPSDYWYAGSGLRSDTDKTRRLAFDASGNHPDNAWMNCLFVDGRVEGARPDGSRTWNVYP